MDLVGEGQGEGEICFPQMGRKRYVFSNRFRVPSLSWYVIPLPCHARV